MVSHAFDYTPLNGSGQQVRDLAAKIKAWDAECQSLAKKTAELAIKIGVELSIAKEKVPHGLWHQWLESEFGWTVRTAQRYMAISEKFKYDTVSHLGISVLAMLAGESVPESARTEIVTRANNGETITREKAKRMVKEHQARTQVNRISAVSAPRETQAELSVVVQSPTPPVVEQPVQPVVEQPAPAPVDVEDQEIAKMRTILKLAGELSIANLALVRKSIDRLHDGKSGVRAAPPAPAPAPQPELQQAKGSLLAFDPLDLRPVDKLNTAKFRAAWTDWVKYNQEQGHSLTESVAVKQLEQLSERSHDAAISAIDKAIADRSKSFPAAKHSRPKFVAPTVQELKAYADGIGYTDFDATRFLDYYESQGWKKSNGQPLVDWKGGVRTWRAMRKEEAQQKPTGSAAVNGAYKQFVPDRVKARRNAQGQQFPGSAGVKVESTSSRPS